MSDELPLDLKPSKKATAKKAPVKKAASAKKAAPAKQAPATKQAAVAAPVAEMPAKKAAAKKAPTKTATVKKAPAKKAAPLEAPAVTQAPAPLIEPPMATAIKPSTRKSALQKKAAQMLVAMQEAVVEVKALTTSEPEPKIESVPLIEPISTAPTPAAESAPTAALPAAGQQAAVVSDQNNTTEGQPQERRKTKFERWKERRERFKQEKIARRLGLEGKLPSPQVGEGKPSNEDDFSRPAEVPLGPPEPADGVLEMTPKGYGFLRQRERMYAQHPNDAFISGDFVRQYGLREGMYVKGISQKGPRGPQITSVAEVNGRVPESMRDMPLFEELKAVNPNKKIQFETRKDRFTTRVIDMFTPVGRGQRGLIVAPPRAGKTTLLQHIAEAVVENHPGMHLMILLVDERPEEVTEFKRILPKAEIYASSNDQDVKSHTRIASFAIERAKRLVECGDHVFILMDSITRLARAFNNAKQGGATGSGGMGVGAMEIPRRLFAAARNTRSAGSLTILATALIETGSRMDDVIFQEFKGTGNMELVLDRKIAEQFYYPAVNIFKSGTRREELLLQPFQLDKIHMLRRGLAGHKPIDAIQRVLQLFERYPSNAQMLVDLPSKS
jgi:transcription termination factor Rho